MEILQYSIRKLIAGIPLTMILAATWLWYFVVRGDLDLVCALGTANQGTLVQPVIASSCSMYPALDEGRIPSAWALIRVSSLI